MCGPANGFRSPLNEGFGVAGEELAVTLRIALQCPSGITPRATVTVRDPNNVDAPLLEGEATRDAQQLSGEGMQTVVKIRATLPGPYHFTARFEPNLGLAQKDILVAENHRDAGPELVLPAGHPLSSCPQIDVTAGGRPLCLQAGIRVFERDGGALQTLGSSNALAARVGDVLWVVEQTSLSRWSETAGGFIGAPDGGFFPRTQRPRIAADSSGVFLSQSGQLDFVDWDAGFVELQQGFLAVASEPVAVWKRGEEYLLLGQGTFEGDSTLCSGRFLDGGRCDSTGMFGRRQVPLAVERAGLWTWFEDFTSFAAPKVIALRTGGTLRELTLPPNWSPRDGGFTHWDTGAWMRDENGRVMLLKEEQGSFVLQKFPDLPLHSVTSEWVTLRGSSGELIIYRR